MKKIVAIILGIEIGLLVWFILFQTLIIYIVVGITNYILPFISLAVLNYLTILICCVIFSALTLLTVEKYFKRFVLSIFCLPALSFVFYLIFLSAPNKAKAVAAELSKHNINQRTRSSFYNKYQNQIENMLLDFTNLNSATRNNLHLEIFGVEEKKAEHIKVDTLFISPDEKFGVCLFTLFYDSLYRARALFFSIQDKAIKELFAAPLLSGGYATTPQQALMEMKYDIFITSKKRIVEDENAEHYSTKKLHCPNILDNNYWKQTIQLDTAKMGLYGSIKN